MAKRLRAWKAEYLVLTRPLGRVTAETGNSKSARQATFDGRFDQIGCEEGQRDRHIDLADAAFFARGDLFDISHGARDDFIEPAPATSDRRDELGAGLRTNRASILRCCEFWHDDLAPPFRRCRPLAFQRSRDSRCPLYFLHAGDGTTRGSIPILSCSVPESLGRPLLGSAYMT